MDPFVSMTEPYSVLLDANSDETFRILKNKSWDAHLDHLGFPKMYESQLCGDWCGRKPDAMNPSKGGTDRRTNRRRRTDRPKSSTLYPSASRGITYALMTQVRVAFLSIRSLLTLRCHSNICSNNTCGCGVP